MVGRIVRYVVVGVAACGAWLACETGVGSGRLLGLLVLALDYELAPNRGCLAILPKSGIASNHTLGQVTRVRHVASMLKDALSTEHYANSGVENHGI